MSRSLTSVVTVLLLATIGAACSSDAKTTGPSRGTTAGKYADAWNDSAKKICVDGGNPQCGIGISAIDDEKPASIDANYLITYDPAGDDGPLHGWTLARSFATIIGCSALPKDHPATALSVNCSSGSITVTSST